MKKIISALLLSVGSFLFVHAQSGPPLDKSPLDLSTYPVNFAMMQAQGRDIDPLVARVLYSRPQKNNRVIFGDLIKYNEVWRLGANENTEIEFFRDVKINNVKVKKGRYSLFAIPAADKWTLIINSDLNVWGAFKYDGTKDIVRMDVPVQTAAPIAEAFYITFEKTPAGFDMNAGWDNVKISLPISM